MYPPSATSLSAMKCCSSEPTVSLESAMLPCVLPCVGIGRCARGGDYGVPFVLAVSGVTLLRTRVHVIDCPPGLRYALTCT